MPLNASRPFAYLVLDSDWNDAMAAINANTAKVAELLAMLFRDLPHNFGGSSAQPFTQTAYPAGASISVIAPSTDLFVIDCATIPAGTYYLVAILQNIGGGTTVCGLFNLTDAPNTFMVQAASTAAAGERVVAGPITFPTTGTKTFAVKVAAVGGTGYAWGIKLERIS